MDQTLKEVEELEQAIIKMEWFSNSDIQLYTAQHRNIRPLGEGCFQHGAERHYCR